MACRRPEKRQLPLGMTKPLCALVVCLLACDTAHGQAQTDASAAEVSVRQLVDDAGDIIDLAVAPNGQRLYCLAAAGQRVVSVDCGRNAAAAVRTVIEGESPDGPGRRIGCIDSSVVVILRDATTAVVTTHRIPPNPETAVASPPLQRVVVNEALPKDVADGMACLTVSHTRNWLAVTSRSDGLATVLRAAVAGVRLGSFSTRHSPELEAGTAVLAATVSPADELVLVTSAKGASSAAEPGAGDTLSMHATPGGWDLLRLDTGLRDIRDVCFTQADGGLWVITGGLETADPPQPAGLWRLDAALRNRRQAVEAVLVTLLKAPRALAAGSDNVLYAVVDDGQQVLEIRPEADRD